MKSKLFCTFTELENVEPLIKQIQLNYVLTQNNIFILKLENKSEYICTYSIDHNNLSELPSNTILVHRNKNFNVLYSINALNKLIKTLNNGTMDFNYIINWEEYRNSILLVNNEQLSKVNTILFRIIHL